MIAVPVANSGVAAAAGTASGAAGIGAGDMLLPGDRSPPGRSPPPRLMAGAAMFICARSAVTALFVIVARPQVDPGKGFDDGRGLTARLPGLPALRWHFTPVAPAESGPIPRAVGGHSRQTEQSPGFK